MSKNKTRRALQVLMNGTLVGQLTKAAEGSLVFVYSLDWLNTPEARPISLSIPLIKQPFVGDVVYNFFDNLLPDNIAMRSRIQAMFHVPTHHPFDLLAAIGQDCVGAIQLIDGEEVPQFERKIKFKLIDSSSLANILLGYKKHPLGMSKENVDFRISIAGAQEKMAFLYYKGQWVIPLEDTPTSHIFKLPIGLIAQQELDLRDSCENEWLCSEIAAAFGLRVAKAEILHFNNAKVLAVERFDRKWSSDNAWLMRLPQEDLCQALGYASSLKYQADGGPGIKEIMHFLLGSRFAADDRDFFYRAQILFWLLAAIDGHAKNFSVFIEPQGQYSLTPLYDIISAHPLMSNKQLQAQKIKMAMALKGKNYHYRWYNLQLEHFISTAKFVNYPIDRARKILSEMLGQVDAVINTVGEKLPADFPQKIAQPIFEGMCLTKQKLAQFL